MSLTHIAFELKYIFTSNIQCPLYLVHTGIGDLCPSSILNATKRLYLYLEILSHQRVFPLFRTICLACLIEDGTSIPNLCVFLDTREFILAMIMSRFLKLCGTRHANAGSSSIPLALTKSATSIGFDYLIKISGTHCFFSSFHRISKRQPTVV